MIILCSRMDQDDLLSSYIQINSYIQQIDIHKAIIVLKEKSDAMMLKKMLIENDFPCDSRYMVLSEQMFKISSFFLDSFNTLFVSKNCDIVLTLSKVIGKSINIVCLR